MSAEAAAGMPTSDVPPLLLPRRPLGQTGLELSVLGFGASALGGVFEEVAQAAAVASVKRALACGVNYFDTSPFYGATKSETVLGRALQGVPRHKFIVSTKVGRYGSNPEDFDFSAARVERSLSESLARLQLEYVDMVLCHDIEFGDLDQVCGEALPALAALRAAGKIKAVGVSCLPLSLLRHMADALPPGTLDFVISYCHCCLNDSTLLGLIPHLTAKGISVVNASALSMGLLTAQGPPAWHPAPPKLQQACREAAAGAQGAGSDISRLAIAFALRQKVVVSTLVSMPSPELVDANVTCAMQALGLQPNPHAASDAKAEVAVTQMLQGVQGQSWPSGNWRDPAQHAPTPAIAAAAAAPRTED